MPRKDAREAPASIDTSQPADTGLVSPPPPVAAAAGAPAASRNSSTPVSASAAAAAAVAAGSLATDPAPTVHVNKAHLAEIKTSLDDIVKQVGTESNLGHWTTCNNAGAALTIILPGSRGPGVYPITAAPDCASRSWICERPHLARRDAVLVPHEL